jgi:hypothetical protein
MKSQSLPLDVEAVAENWAVKMVQVLGKVGLTESELHDHVTIIRRLVSVAANLINEDPVLRIPNRPNQMPMTPDHADLILDLFVRGVNQSIKAFNTQRGLPQDRNVMLEQSAWEIFNLSKVMTALLFMPQPETQSMLQNENQLRMMLRPSVEEILAKLLGKPSPGQMGGMS